MDVQVFASQLKTTVSFPQPGISLFPSAFPAFSRQTDLISEMDAIDVNPGYNEMEALAQSIPASYIIFKIGSTYYAKACFSGGTNYSGTDAATVINNAILAMPELSGKLFIKAGTYDAAIVIPNAATSQYLWIQGEGKHTHIRNTANSAVIDVQGTSGTKLQAIYISDMLIEGANDVTKTLNYGIKAWYLEKCHFWNLEVWRCYMGMRAFIVTDSVFEFKTVYSSTNHGLYFDTCDNFRVSGGLIGSNAGYGIVVKSVFNAGFDGVWANNNTQFGMRLDTSIKNRITGCQFKNNDYANAATYDGLMLLNESSNNIVANCVFEDNDRYNLNISEADCANNVVANNQFINADVQGAVQNLGTGTLIGKNVGYVTENKGTGSIANGATTAVITHGLAYTPAAADITIIPTEQPTNNPGAIWISTITSTQFTVNSLDPGASNLDFSWAVRKV